MCNWKDDDLRVFISSQDIFVDDKKYEIDEEIPDNFKVISIRNGDWKITRKNNENSFS